MTGGGGGGRGPSFVERNDTTSTPECPIQTFPELYYNISCGLNIFFVICLVYFRWYHKKINKSFTGIIDSNDRFVLELQTYNNYLTDNLKKSTMAIGELKVMDAALKQLSENRVDDLEKVLIPSADIKLLQMLGKGANGEVHLAEYQGKKIALKRLLRITEESVERFRFECFLMKDLRHPNIVKLVGVCW